MIRRSASFSLVFLVVLSASAQRAPKLPEGATMRQNVVISPCSLRGKVELRKLTELTATGGVLDTRFELWPTTTQVPVLKADGTCNTVAFEAAMYKDPVTGFLAFPGPTLRVHRQTPAQPGDSIRVLLQNYLKASSNECIWEGAGKELCDCTASPQPRCCGQTTKPTDMNCFHGSSTTNLHFHGTHVSPQEPQDWVFLQLKPFGAVARVEGEHMMGDPGDVRVGQFQYALDPLGPKQPEGTHWYHPHKHGSTAEQVGFGLAGALLIDGPFDDWLKGQYGGRLEEKVMVIQQVHDLNFNSLARVGSPMPLINGQLTPRITMRPGEVQRWRMISATMEASAQLIIDFNGLVPENKLQARQIAMDGIQFSPTNYRCQPLLNEPSPCTPRNDPKFRLSPGNRADFLIKAPNTPGMELLIPYEVFGAVENQGEVPVTERGLRKEQVQREVTRASLDALAPGDLQPALLAVYICRPGVDIGCTTASMDFPATWPALPEFLRPITPNKSQNVQFQVLGGTAPPLPDGQFGVQMRQEGKLQFVKFDDRCANFTVPLDPAGGEEWRLSQNINRSGNPFHVFHIHINPFQVLGTEIRQSDGTYRKYFYSEPIWQDSITLPDNGGGGDADNPGRRIVIRQRFEDFTGPYVIHCHFLGHEDRGMMVMVQTVCKDKPDSYSVTSKERRECTFGQYVKARPPCPLPKETEAAHGSH